MIKWMKETGEFFIVCTIGYCLLEISQSGPMWHFLLFLGALFKYLAQHLEK